MLVAALCSEGTERGRLKVLWSVLLLSIRCRLVSARTYLMTVLVLAQGLENVCVASLSNASIHLEGLLCYFCCNALALTVALFIQ